MLQLPASLARVVAPTVSRIVHIARPTFSAMDTLDMQALVSAKKASKIAAAGARLPPPASVMRELQEDRSPFKLPRDPQVTAATTKTTMMGEQQAGGNSPRHETMARATNGTTTTTTTSTRTSNPSQAPTATSSSATTWEESSADRAILDYNWMQDQLAESFGKYEKDTGRALDLPTSLGASTTVQLMENEWMRNALAEVYATDTDESRVCYRGSVRFGGATGRTSARFYAFPIGQNPNGATEACMIAMPSVSTVLSAVTTKSVGLLSTEARLSTDAMMRGTWVHEALENRVRALFPNMQPSRQMFNLKEPCKTNVENVQFVPEKRSHDLRSPPADTQLEVDSMVARIWSEIGDRISDVSFAETVVVHPTLGYAGTIDCVAKVDGQWTIVDWKTFGEDMSRSQERYTYQVAAYLDAFNNDPYFRRLGHPPATRCIVAGASNTGYIEVNVTLAEATAAMANVRTKATTFLRYFNEVAHSSPGKLAQSTTTFRIALNGDSEATPAPATSRRSSSSSFWLP
ncbi:hypothetical protein CAOG_02878 [Capsaspora owczarzaki ATCC 30864]|uniref:PD-(D/E)XK endonuclease-like domain-containing protein n=1 Tax=Capsaspora owczarzaki (strain ATCC 30864) TaxID=595528 RepID=A0A0D2X220_CAPO3|nr:hypothetical protein CAOG_02878 [Capsaspora owczarzaki ATCC 30864]KJE91794.1 hypothetical protein CAOG_002878 [Capsaspora owczarzaki ATCC 30864]|eukprot:XP_004363717.2 hypothetical protein CAOG_02878 [Capsaspora owczarzaki ATCC 30864]